MERDPLVYAVIGRAMAVHREIGTGLDEVFYHKLLDARLTANGIEHWSKPRRPLRYRGFTADAFEPDLVLPKKLVLELKVLAGRFCPEHFLQLKAYLKFWRIRQGLLLDFGKESLVMQSYLYDDPRLPQIDPSELIRGVPPTVERRLARSLAQCLSRIVSTHGFGYRDSTYRSLLLADARAEGKRWVSAPTAAVRVGDMSLGLAVLSRIVVAGQSAVLVLSQREGIRAADRAALQTALQLLELPWGVIVHFGKQELKLQWILPSTQQP